MPPALRERIAVLVETSGDAAADGTARVPLDGIVAAVEESLPAFLRGRGTYDRTEHPGGEAFFQAGEPLSDDAAERIARAQLSREARGLLGARLAQEAEGEMPALRRHGPPGQLGREPLADRAARLVGERHGQEQTHEGHSSTRGGRDP